MCDAGILAITGAKRPRTGESGEKDRCAIAKEASLNGGPGQQNVTVQNENNQ
jgi:hypothetical protein